MNQERLFSLLEETGYRIGDLIERTPFAEAAKILKTGADGTPTRNIDHQCEKIFIDSIKSNGLPYDIISEEAGFVDLGGKQKLLVDPLDGTTNALNGIPYYSLSVCVIDSDLRSASVAFVMNLSNNSIYTAVKGEGAYRNGKAIASRKKSGISIVNYGRLPDDYLALIISKATKYRKLGSTALDLCLLASGSVDAVFSIGPESAPRNFDVGAGILLVNEAGGYVSDIGGSPYNLSDDPRERKDMIAVAERSMVDEYT